MAIASCKLCKEIITPRAIRATLKNPTATAAELAQAPTVEQLALIGLVDAVFGHMTQRHPDLIKNVIQPLNGLLASIIATRNVECTDTAFSDFTKTQLHALTTALMDEPAVFTTAPGTVAAPSAPPAVQL